MTEEKKTDVATAPQGRGIQQRRRGALSPFEEMDRMFESLFPRGWMRPLSEQWPEWASLAAPFEGRTPNVDVIDHDNEVVVRAELPGVEKDDLDVSVTEDSVTIKATTRQEKEEEKEGEYHRREISQGSFARTVALPSAVQSDAAKASFKNGVLELTLPKATPAKRHSVKVE